jgi:hypothetical protein
MPKMLKKLAIGASFVSTCLHPLNAFPAECGLLTGTHFTLTCRGPLDHRITWTVSGTPGNFTELTTVEWAFQANDLAAGSLGLTLEEGTCAWEDRPLASAEPRIYRTQINNFVGRQVFHDSLTACSNNSDCVFIVCVSNDGIFLQQYADKVDIRYLSNHPTPSRGNPPPPQQPQ